MKATLEQIAALLHARLEGDGQVMIDDLAGLETAGPHALSFLGNPKYEPLVYETQAGGVLVPMDFAPRKPVSGALLRVENPYLAFTRLLEEVARMRQDRSTGIDPKASVDPTAKVDPTAYVGPFACIGKEAVVGPGARIHAFAFLGTGVEVGENSIIHPHVAVYEGCKVGANCLIHAGTVVGADGFGFAPQPDGTYRKIPQLGVVVLEDGVEIGANSCIDRATMGATTLASGAKLDNLVQVAHNAFIGENSVIAAQAGIAGSTRLGRQVMVGGQAGFVGHITIADGTKIDAQSGVNKTIEEPGQAFRGSPIQPHRQQLRSELMFRKLVEMEARIRSLEQELSQQRPQHFD